MKRCPCAPPISERLEVQGRHLCCLLQLLLRGGADLEEHSVVESVELAPAGRWVPRLGRAELPSAQTLPHPLLVAQAPALHHAEGSQRCACDGVGQALQAAVGTAVSPCSPAGLRQAADIHRCQVADHRHSQLLGQVRPAGNPFWWHGEGVHEVWVDYQGPPVAAGHGASGPAADVKTPLEIKAPPPANPTGGWRPPPPRETR